MKNKTVDPQKNKTYQNHKQPELLRLVMSQNPQPSVVGVKRKRRAKKIIMMEKQPKIRKVLRLFYATFHACAI